MQQDPVEILFGKIRSLGGYNSNPSCEQFSAAFRKLLAYNILMYSKFSNCNLDENSPSNPFSNILSITSRRSATTFNISECMEVSEEDIEKFYENLGDAHDSENENMNDPSIATVAKLIEQRITTTKQFDCLQCKEIFVQNTRKAENLFVGNRLDGKPCYSTFQICKQTDRFLKPELLKGNINFNVIYHEIIESLNFESLYEQTDFSDHSDHKIYFIRYIVDEYVRIKGTNFAKNATLHEHQKTLQEKVRKMRRSNPIQSWLSCRKVRHFLGR